MKWWERHRRVVGVVGAVVATGLAVLWVVVVPARAAEATGVRLALIRWGHPACWALLAVVAALFAADAAPRVRQSLAWAAAGCYAGFLAATLL